MHLTHLIEFFLDGASEVTTSSGIYYAPSYFPGDYFTPSYFPGDTSSVVVYGTLLEAMLGRLNAHLSASFPGGFWTERAARAPALPYAVIDEIGESADYFTSDGSDIDYLDEGELQVSVFAKTRTGCRDLAKSIQDALDDAPLTFTDGKLMVLRRDQRMPTEIDPERGIDGSNVWVKRVTYGFTVSRTI